jgi:tetratricopeptide (TPR) repeat protein
MNNETQSRVEHFATLKSKYQATKYDDSSPSSVLYLILRKADLGIEITEIERNWLREHKLLETLEAIRKELRYREKELRKLESEFFHLKSTYKATTYHVSWKSSPLYFILYRLDSENKLTDPEVNWLKSYGLTETIAIAQQMEHFATLKAKYQATEHQDSSPVSRLYRILKQLDAEERLSNSDVNWLNEHEVFETLAISQQQEAAREAEFAKLKDKYQATKYPDSCVSSPLYSILQNLNVDKQLSESEIGWLEQHELTETLNIVLEIEQKGHFAELKAKYKATQYEDSSPYSHLYKVLKKLESDNQLGEQDINFLKKRKLTDTITIAQDKYAATLKSKIEIGEQLEESEIEWLKENGRENLIASAQQRHFGLLKVKYRILDPRNKLPIDPFYTIMQQLEREERLDPVLVVQLIEKDLLSPEGRIALAFHRLEALFFEQEYQRTGNQWNLPNASSHWRKTGKPRQALKLTENLNFDKISENKLKSALLTTRGGAFRDIEELDKAEKCARQAIEYQPNSHHPYTLMGAICYERREYSKGDYWFEEAIKRGASPSDQDAEIKRVVKNAKDENKRREVVEYLLKKDPSRYAWAKSYLKKPQNQGR